MRRFFIFWIVILLVLNCRSKSERQTSLPKPTAHLAEQTDEIVVEKLDEFGLRKLLSQRNGKVLFLNVWATWCIPCREEFPDIVQLSKEYQQNKVEFVGLSVDYPDEISTKIIPFLRSVRANFKIYVQDFKDPAVLIQRLDANWSGAIPATFIFDAEGSRQATFIGMGSYEQFKKELDKVLTH
ncbi:MAG: TlpA family protein disulfide reductase [candidate division KSB1 bacterium]|nr:TlpA family protein disulfide reductase [candidate division KSB1 bacterium]MDZ7336052.1 TlpA family protein disulfide reductase [candidate division KSB1 bacterium]MDZ7358060.1 TlpA family protein disulfide reductase [candidate division KSB1 bacterium]MDZ7402237.1 TlpA family protein disulfide reductase [candidate division KSB1 bacterium]